MKQLLSVFALFALATVAIADQKIVLKKSTDGIPSMGQEASEQLAETWFGEGTMRRDDGDTSMILRVDKSEFYIENHKNKTYNVLTIPFTFMDLFPEEQREAMKPMFENMKMNATVEKTEETAKVGPWNASLYKIKITNPMGLEVSIDSWTTKEIKIDRKLMEATVKNILAFQPGSSEIYDVFMSIEGYPVQQNTVMNMMGNEFKSSEEVISVEEVDAPKGHYAPNPAYTLEAFDIQQMMGARGGM